MISFVIYASALIASKGLLEMPEKPKTLVGHLGVNNNKKMQREEMVLIMLLALSEIHSYKFSSSFCLCTVVQLQRKAVSTSHCSQPNTIEYEMAMDWILVQEKTVNCFNRLHKVKRFYGYCWDVVILIVKYLQTL